MKTMIKKVQKLEEIKKKLKQDFVGIDDVIDKVIKSISPWYFTPEVIERPLVVSLWGLTGTGKTSLIRKLVEYLEMSEKMIYFDCGELDKDSGQAISSVIDSTFGDEDFLGGPKNDVIFVFDEFQTARTIDIHGEEISKANLRAVWSVMDSGILDINEYRYDVVKFNDFVCDLEQFIQENPGIPIKDGFYDKGCIETVMNTLGIFHYDTRFGDDEDAEDKKDKLEILPRYLKRTFITYLSKHKSGFGYSEYQKLLHSTTLEEYLSILMSANKIISSPKRIDCSKSLVFILGNLDEAYNIHDDISPEVDADLFRSITEDIGITEVKTALQERFRNEQIGRFGNNLITYPSLSKSNFEEIIEKETSRILDKFKNNVSVKVGSNFKKLIYNEGVFPVQGVRPVLTTVGNLLTSRLSTVICEKTPDTSYVVIDVKSCNYDKDSIDIFITFFDKDDKKIKEVKERENLNLGKLRNIDNCGRIVAQAVHEASHSVVYLKCTNKFPSSIVAVSSMGGGVMYMDYQKSSDIASREEIDKNVMVSLAGYLGEKLFFSDEKCLMGSGNDIREAWEELSDAFYLRGYLDPFKYSPKFGEIDSSGKPLGLLDTKVGVSGIRSEIEKKFEELKEKTKNILESEKDLIREMALYLSKNRTMSVTTFKNFVKKYSKTMNLEQIKKSEKSLNDYYKSALLGE